MGISVGKGLGKMKIWRGAAALIAAAMMIVPLTMQQTTTLADEECIEIDLSEALSVDYSATLGYKIFGSNLYPYSYYKPYLNNEAMPRNYVNDTLFIGSAASGKTFRLVQSGVRNDKTLGRTKYGTVIIPLIIVDSGVKNLTLILEDINLGNGANNTEGHLLISDGAEVLLLLGKDANNPDIGGSYIYSSIYVASTAVLTIDSEREPGIGSSDGVLSVYSNFGDIAAIGGSSSFDVNSGQIIINGGTVTAINDAGDGSGAAIGGGGCSAASGTAGSGTVTITGGTVTAINNKTNGTGAAIGGGGITAISNNSNVAGSGFVTITGGTVNATNKGSGAAIGGGSAPNGMHGGNGGAVVEITGGTVVATANRGAGIGSGATGFRSGTESARTITLGSGASVRAYSSGVDLTSSTWPAYAKPAIDVSIIGAGSGYFVNNMFTPATMTILPAADLRMEVISGGRLTQELELPGGYRCFAYNTGASGSDSIYVYNASTSVIVGAVVRAQDDSPEIYSITTLGGYNAHNSAGQNQAWLPVKITPNIFVIYHPNGGTGNAYVVDTGVSLLTPPATVAIQNNINPDFNFTHPAGLKFLGWNTSPDGTGTSYTAGGVFELNVGLVLYAQWGDRYMVTKDGDSSWGVKWYYWLADAVDACGTDGPYTITATDNDSDMSDTARAAGVTAPAFIGSHPSPIVISPSKAVTLTSDTGNQWTITQKDLGRHFRVRGSLTLRDIILSGDSTVMAGPVINGGIWVTDGGKLTMEDEAVIQYGYAGISDTKTDTTGAGGGVNVGEYSYFVMNGGLITHNKVITSAGGSITAGGIGGGVYVLGTFAMNGGEISHNEAGSGGGVIVTQHVSTIIITRANPVVISAGVFVMKGGRIVDNCAYNNGGGLYSVTTGTCEMWDGEISGNFLSSIAYSTGGGGACIADGIFTMYGGTINDNRAPNGRGGGLYLNGGTFKMLGGTIADNTAEFSGGGIYLLPDASLVITLGTISGNSAQVGRGGGIYLPTYNPALIDIGQDTVFSGNTSSQSVLVPFTASELLAMFPAIKTTSHSTHATLTFVHPLNNDDINIFLDRYIVTRDDDGSFVGIYHWLAEAVKACGTDGPYTITATGNDEDMSDTLAGTLQADPAGPIDPVYKNLAVIIPVTKSITLTSGTANPWMITQRAQVRHLIVDGELTLINIILDGDETGGGIEVTGNLNIGDDAIIQHCYTVGSGGGVYANGGRVIMTGGLIRNNEADMGGGVAVYGGALGLDGGDITDNLALLGGGVAVLGNPVDEIGSAFLIASGSVAGNHARGIGSNGGGVYIFSANPARAKVDFIVTGGTVSGNDTDGGGGGVCLIGADGIMLDGEISGNQSLGFGGGMLVGAGGTFTMRGGFIDSNEADNGGGVLVQGGTFIMFQGSVSGNDAAVDGGGVYLASTDNELGTFVMHDGIVSDNIAVAGNGGGVLVRSDAFFYLGDNPNIVFGPPTISGNQAPSGHGGGIYAQSYAALSVAPNAVFYDNEASEALDLGISQADYIALFQTALSPPAGIYSPWGDFYSLCPGFTALHPLNNYDINVVKYPVVEKYVDVNGLPLVPPVPDTTTFVLYGGLYAKTIPPVSGYLPIGWMWAEDYDLLTAPDFPITVATAGFTAGSPAGESVTGERTVYFIYDIGTTLTVSKTVAGKMGNKTVNWEFTLYLEDDAHVPLAQGTTFSYLVYETGTTTVVDTGLLTLDAAGKAIFRIKHNQTVVIEGLTPDGYVSLAEKANINYETLFIDSDDVTATPVYKNETGILAMTVEREFHFTNTWEEIVPPTGLNLDTLPFVGLIILALGGLMAVVALKSGSRRSRLGTPGSEI